MRIIRLFAGVLALCLLAGELLAQQPGQPQAGTPGGQPQAGGRRGNKKAAVPLPDDPQLQKLHRQFIQEAEKLALEYQRTNQLDKAKACYQEIARFVPSNNSAQASLQKILGKEATAQRKTLDIVANKGWQDSGLDVIEGKPVMFRAVGTWHILLDYEVPTDGIEIPKELRKFNLGSLIAIVIPPGHQPGDTNYTDVKEPPAEAPSEKSTDEKQADESTDKPAANDAAASTEPAATDAPAESEEGKDRAPKPFLVGKQLDWIANRTGRLYLRMYDADPKDNTGKLTVTLSGTFGVPDSASSESSSSSK